MFFEWWISVNPAGSMDWSHRELVSESRMGFWTKTERRFSWGEMTSLWHDASVSLDPSNSNSSLATSHKLIMGIWPYDTIWPYLTTIYPHGGWNGQTEGVSETAAPSQPSAGPPLRPGTQSAGAQDCPMESWSVKIGIPKSIELWTIIHGGLMNHSYWIVIGLVEIGIPIIIYYELIQD